MKDLKGVTDIRILRDGGTPFYSSNLEIIAKDIFVRVWK